MPTLSELSESNSGRDGFLKEALSDTRSLVANAIRQLEAQQQPSNTRRLQRSARRLMRTAKMHNIVRNASELAISSPGYVTDAVIATGAINTVIEGDPRSALSIAAAAEWTSQLKH